MISDKKIINVALKILKNLMEAGSEAYLAEEAAEIILEKAGYNESIIVINSTSVSIALTPQTPTFVRPVKSRDINLQKINDVWEIVQQVKDDQLDLNAIDEAIFKINKNEKSFSFLTQVLGAGAMSGGILFLLGGRHLEILYAFILGALIYVINDQLTKRIHINYAALFISSIILGAVVVILHKAGLVKNEIAMLVGGLMPFYPGVELTTGLTDIMFGDLNTGTTRIVEGLIISTILGSGCVLALSLHISGVL